MNYLTNNGRELFVTDGISEGRTRCLRLSGGGR